MASPRSSSNMGNNDNESPAKSVDNTSEELTVFVQDMLDRMQSRFDDVGDSIIGRMDAVGKRMDNLEQSITDLMEQAGLDAPHDVDSGTAGTPENRTKESAVL